MTSQSTKDKHSNNGQYYAYRKRIHQNIVRTLLLGYPSQAQPEITFMGGGTATGKSTIRDIHLSQLPNPDEFIIIDCDSIKEMIPEYKQLQKENKDTAANLVHQESGDIAEMLLEEALQHRLHIMFDGTMKDYEYYYDLIQRIKEMGYIVSALVVHAPIEVAFEREEERALIDQRRVPKWAIEESHAKVGETFGKLKSLFDAYRLWDNSGDFEQARVILRRRDRDSEEEVIDARIVAEFFRTE